MNNNEPSIVDLERGQYEENKKTTTTAINPQTILNENENKRGNYENDMRSKPNSLIHILRVFTITGGILILTALVVIIWVYFSYKMGVPALLVALLLILIASGKWRWFYIAALTAPRDIRALFRYVKLLLMVKRLNSSNASIADVFAGFVAKTPDKACFIADDREWTFREVNEYSNRIANIFHAHGYKNGDKVGLLLENRPEYICIWLGLSKLGIIVPLINTNLRLSALVHSITISKCQALIFGQSYTDAIVEVSNLLPSSLALYQLNDEINQTVYDNSKDLATLITSTSKELPSTNIQKPNHHDQLLYIFTSGTTGLPKAAVITHSRYIFIAAAIHYVSAFRDDDIFYTPLPLYHTAGGVMSIGQALLFGSTVAIRKKFSASGFFSDCQKYKCSIAQYIGEMCRYILATPSSATDTNHKVRLIFGNGLRPQIWPQFVKRFDIPNVREFYGATEGNANIVNIDNTVGAIGFVSRIIPSVYPISIIRADPATGEPIRGPNGLCQLCRPNEPGVFIGKILPNNPSRAFLGYVDKTASDKKIVRDVFTLGDSAFLSGDLLTADERGNLFFQDRTGDTFRWKGENVSTSEVEAQVSNEAGYRDCVVYGVEIPNMEGRAGMAAILDPERKVDLDALANNLKKVLPPYARPLFVRLLVKVDMTGTFKLKKLDLQKECFNPSNIEDPVYFLNNKGSYQLLTVELYGQICKGEIRF